MRWKNFEFWKIRYKNVYIEKWDEKILNFGKEMRSKKFEFSKMRYKNVNFEKWDERVLNFEKCDTKMWIFKNEMNKFEFKKKVKSIDVHFEEWVLKNENL